MISIILDIVTVLGSVVVAIVMADYAHIQQIKARRQRLLDVWADEREAEGLDPWAGGTK